ncbi:hypothetical protein [Xylophilus rhododendri]|uniref:hypothetical protein n=1 Tax=Xylophilus rhododendri TaxID=2697032 RepID=UPI0018A33348|nr:hypothetical protein [Xylophilus rhododendri]
MRIDKLVQGVVQGIALLAVVNRAQDLPPARMMGRPIGDRQAANRHEVLDVLDGLGHFPITSDAYGAFGPPTPASARGDAAGADDSVDYYSDEDSESEAGDMQIIRIREPASTPVPRTFRQRTVQPDLHRASFYQLTDLHMAVHNYFQRLVRTDFALPIGHPFADHVLERYVKFRRTRISDIDRQIGVLRSQMEGTERERGRLEISGPSSASEQAIWLDRIERLQLQISGLTMDRELIEEGIRNATAVFGRAKAFCISLQQIVRAQVAKRPEAWAPYIYQAAKGVLDQAYASLFSDRQDGAMVEDFLNIGGYVRDEVERLLPASLAESTTDSSTTSTTTTEAPTTTMSTTSTASTTSTTTPTVTSTTTTRRPGTTTRRRPGTLRTTPRTTPRRRATARATTAKAKKAKGGFFSSFELPRFNMMPPG